MKILIIWCIAFSILIFNSCGDPTVSVEGFDYKPQFIVDAFINGVDGDCQIRVKRNFPIGSNISEFKDADSVVVILKGVRLPYVSKYDMYRGILKFRFQDSLIDLNISGYIDGKYCKTSAKTKLLHGALITSDQYLGYFEYGDSISFYVGAHNNATFYTMNIYPQSPGGEYNFIHKNPYLTWEQYQVASKGFIRTVIPLYNIHESSEEVFTIHLKDTYTWFYTTYWIEVTGGDQNYKDYVMTSKTGMEFDGNFHAVHNDFDGDGVGVFTSVFRVYHYFNLLEQIRVLYNLNNTSNNNNNELFRNR
ncbi:MAG: hypothetical protein HYV28_01190 [Ignavibacteriales bacterium]|nr:hypothetical protein [Ignavibacteriales bacterium]